MIYTNTHHEIICNHNSEFINLANTITWITDGAPYMRTEYDLLLAFISKDYNRIRQEIQPFFFREENFMEDITNMYNKVLEAEMEIVYENIMQDLVVELSEDGSKVEVKKWTDEYIEAEAEFEEDDE
jgi:hypothetical protein